MESFRGALVCPSVRTLWKKILKGDTMVGSRGKWIAGGVCPGMTVWLKEAELSYPHMCVLLG